MKRTILQIENFSFAFGDEMILKEVSLAGYEGEYLSVIGPNGAGKSTLLKCLMRILRGGAGKITLGGRPLCDYRQKELARMISYVPQGGGTPILFTVAEYVIMGRYPYLSPLASFSREDRHAAREALELTGTAHLAHRRLDTLSGGEFQTVCIASVIAQGARILLLDEPTTFLDPKHESDVLEIIKKINREFGITIISVTHDINNAALESDRIIALKGGEVMFDGLAGEIMNNEILELIYDRRFSFVEHPDNGKLVIVPSVQ